MRNNFFVTVARIAVVYVALALCRIVFFAVNADMLGPVDAGDFWNIASGSLRFDSASVCYAFSLFMFLSLLPLRCRVSRAYQALLFVVWFLPAVVTVVLNMADAVYFRGARKRFTFDDLHFLRDGDNNGAIVLQALGENILVIALALLFIMGMTAAYRRIKVDPSTEFRRPVVFYTVNTVLLALAVFLSVGAIRGGYTRTTRPITLSNAAEWVSSPSQSALVLSNPFCVIRTMGNKTVEVTEFFASEVRDSIFSPYHAPSATGGMSRRNRSEERRVGKECL